MGVAGEKIQAGLGHRIVISGYFGFNNAGDEAILTSMLGSLRKHPGWG